MSEVIDWSTPIQAGRPSSLISEPAPRINRFHGVRDEQIRRAAVLIAAAGGTRLTKATVRRTVERLAAAVPGLRYKSGMLIFSGLAPVTSLFGDDLPGNNAGRPAKWSGARLRQFAAEVAAIQAERSGMKPDEALRILKARMTADRKYPPSLKTLRNQLSEARRQSQANAKADR